MKGSDKQNPAWVWAIIILMALFIIFLFFRLYMTTSTLDNAVLLLIKQVWTLRETALLRIYGAEKDHISWDFDAISVPGVKGELLLRRFMLQCEYLSAYKGFQTTQLDKLRNRIEEIDLQLTKYSLHVSKITSLTLKMISDIFHGNNMAAMAVTHSIVARLRLL
jgi:hypothetical protein